jgi:ribose 1,5-bisphosphokinase
MLVLVVGPSGAGKDTLLDAAKQALVGDRRFHFVRRVITRPQESGGEDHEAVTEAEFRRRDFALQWQAHGLSYGIPADSIDTSRVVVANVSRTVVAEAVERFAAQVIEITASADLLAARIGARGRENAADIGRRLSRHVDLPYNIHIERVVNDGSLAEGAARFLAALNRATSAVLR